MALESIDKVRASATMLTWHAGTFVNLRFAVCALVSRRAGARVSIDRVDARVIQGAGITRTLVNIVLAVGAFKTCRTFAGVSIDSVDADGPVPAGDFRAFVDVGLAVGPREAWAASTRVAADGVAARSTVLTGRAGAFVEVNLTVTTCSRGAHEMTSKLDLGSIHGGPEQTERDTSHNMWMQCLVSVYEVTSERNDTKISNFGSVVCFLGHIL